MTRPISQLLDDAARCRMPDFPLMGAVYGKLFGMNDEAKYDLVTEAWAYALKSFDPSKSKWSTYFYNTADMIRLKKWCKEARRVHKPPTIAYQNDPEFDFISALPARGTEDAAEIAEMLDAVRRLPPRTAAIVIARFGLDDKPPMTLDALASKVGVSRERIRQVLLEAMEELRGAIA